jgi:hypothetical protein
MNTISLTLTYICADALTSSITPADSMEQSSSSENNEITTVTDEYITNIGDNNDGLFQFTNEGFNDGSEDTPGQED